MVGETVYVIERAEAGRDALNDPVWETRRVRVDDVLVAPGDMLDINESARHEGKDIRYTLYFPKAYHGDLECRQVEVRGEAFDVVGRPDRFDDRICPTRWCMKVSVEAIHG